MAASVSPFGRPEAAAGLAASSSFSSASSSEEKITLFAKPSPYTLAAILVHPPFSVYDEFIIDAGADHGLSTTSLVYAPGGILIGRVADVMSQTSKVLLFSSPGERYEVMIGSGHAPATASGRGGGQYEAELPSNTSVSIGDFVLAPSLSDKAFGIVTSVANSPTMPFETVFFAPPVNIYQLRWVLVK